MAEEKIEVIETEEGYKKFYTNFDRSISSVKIDNITYKIKYISAKDMNAVRKMQKDKKLYEATVFLLEKGLEDWDLKDSNGEILPINKESIENLPSTLFTRLSMIISAKNRDPEPDELENL